MTAPTVWDVVVIGGGPAGATAALAAAESAAAVVLLERAQLPRYKTCGGGLTAVSLAALPAGFVVPASAEARAVTFTRRGRWARTWRDQEPLVVLVNRAEFDAELVGVAALAGVDVRTGVTVTGVEAASGRADGARAVLATTEGPLLARSVVAADGTGSRVARWVGVTLAQVDVGLEVEVPTPVEQADAWRDRVLIDWGPQTGSYGWVFPKGDSLTVGVIGDRADGPALRGYLEELLAAQGLDGAMATISGGHLTRCRQPDSPLHRGPVLVAGDAAGLLEPLMREGISFALRSGRLAGAAAGAIATGDTDAAQRYDDAVRAVLGAEMTAGGQLLGAFRRRPGVFHAGAVIGPGWRLFRRFVRGQTTLPALLAHRGVGRLAHLLSR